MEPRFYCDELVFFVITVLCCRRRKSDKYIRCLLMSVGFEVAFAGFMRLLTIALLFVNLFLFRYKVIHHMYLAECLCQIESSHVSRFPL